MLVLAAVGCFSLPTLFASWMATSRQHWLVQSLPFFGIAFALNFVRTFDLTLIVLVASFLVLFCSNIWHWRQTKKHEQQESAANQTHFQFGLQDFLAGFMWLAILVSLFAQAIKANVFSGEWPADAAAVFHCLMIGAAIAAWGTTLQVLSVLKWRSKVLWFVLLAAVTVGAGWNVFTAEKIALLWGWLAADFTFILPSTSVTKGQSIFGWSVLLTTHALTVGLLSWLLRRTDRQNQTSERASPASKLSTRTTTFKRIAGSMLLLSLLGSLAYFYCHLLPPERYSPMRQVITEKQNRAADLIKAGKAFTNAGLDGWPPLNPGPVLSSNLKTQTKYFEITESALRDDHCFVVDWSERHFDFQASVGNTAEFRQIARALSARALQSLGNGKHDDVVADGLLCYKLADQIAIDGGLLHSLIGTAVEGIGVEAAYSGIKQASSNRLRLAASQLDKQSALYGNVDAELERLVKADSYLMQNTNQFHWLELIFIIFMDQQDVIDSIRESVVRRNVFRSLLRTEIAVALYRDEMGQYPDRLASLVPKFLPKIPFDDFSKIDREPLNYVVSESRDSYHLYSLGPDQDDDGGSSTDAYMAGGDIDLQILEGDRLNRVADEVAEIAAEEAARAKEEAEWAKEEEEWEEGMGDDFFDDLNEPIQEDIGQVE
jgi:hypothetical protein